MSMLAVFNPGKKKDEQYKTFEEYFKTLSFEKQMKMRDEAGPAYHEYYTRLIRATMKKGNENPSKDIHLGQAKAGKVKGRGFAKPYYYWIWEGETFPRTTYPGATSSKKDPSILIDMRTGEVYRHGQENPLKKRGSKSKFTRNPNDFEYRIEAIDPSQSEGKWDYLITIKRLSDGKILTEKVSGGMSYADSVAHRMMKRFSALAARPLTEKSPRSKNPQGQIMSKHVEKIWYQHEEDGKFYKHKFKPGIIMKALPDGSILLYHPTKRIWGNY